jgi:anti-sigma B factor antagonist
VSEFKAAVVAGQAGPVVVLSGEADLRSAARLNELLTAQLAAGTLRLLVDASGLSFADSASVRALVLAGRRLRERGGVLVLVRPQPVVLRVLELLGADQVIQVQGAARAADVEGEPGKPEDGRLGLARWRGA